MPRPRKNRQVLCKPTVMYFKPRALPLSALEEIVLAPDELESLRLADLEGLYQEDAAARMLISRQTFGNIVKSARKKAADALVNGKAIRLECAMRPAAGMEAFICDDCDHRWEASDLAGSPETCPLCSGRNFFRPGGGQALQEHCKPSPAGG